MSELSKLLKKYGGLNVLEVMQKIDQLEARNAELITERDLAIAHDRQPYPTASAYELVCKADREKQNKITELKAVIEWLAIPTCEFTTFIPGEGNEWLFRDRDARIEYARKALGES